MTTKEKLDLLWKYLLLIVLVYGFATLGRSHSMKYCEPGMGRSMGHHKMMFMGGNDWTHGGPGMKNVEVRIEKMEDGDSTMVVTVNGEVVDLDEVDWKALHGIEDIDIDIEHLEDMEGQVFVKKLKKDGKPGHKRIKVMKKKVEDDQ